MRNQKVCFGILGPGKISHRFMKGIAFANNAEVIAVSSRDKAKAQTYAEQYQIPYVYDDYEAMLKNDEIDIVYIATIPSVHFEHIMLCLKHNKSVMCEKPLLAESEQIKACFAYAKQQGLFLMEAQKAPFNYLNQEILHQIQNGLIGEVKYIEASYCYDGFASKYDHWVFRYEDGGGMFDVGVYAIAYANLMAQSTIKNIKAMANRAITGCDVFAVALLEYQNGIKAQVKGAIELKTENKAMIYGTKGYIETYDFWKNDHATVYLDDKCYQITVEMPTDFFPEIEHAIACVLNGLVESPIMSESASLEIMKVLEHVKQVK